MLLKKLNLGTGHIRQEWPVLLVVTAVLLPTACVLWLINDGIRNQRLAVKQKLAEAYSSELSLVRDGLDADWSAQAARLDSSSADAEVFAAIVNSGIADSAIIRNPAGVPVYPALPKIPVTDPTASQPEWNRARQLEATDLSAAASAYTALAQTPNKSMAARALQAAARCLAQSGKTAEAGHFAAQHFRQPGFDQSSDLQGRLIAADALLFAVQVLKPEDPDRLPAARHLRQLLLDYNSAMPSAQRVFLMKEMRAAKLPQELVAFPTLAAEELATQFLEADPKPHAETALRQSALPGVWKLASVRGRVIALLRTETVVAKTRIFLSRHKLPAALRVELSPPGEASKIEASVQIAPAGANLPGWELALSHSGPDPFTELAARQTALYLWIGFLVTAAVAVLALVAARLIGRSLRLAGMKADLVAVVSHELKTPLSSMRLLVDTLLDDAVLDAQKTREYLELIARENARLSLLIGNFLTFSRMERKKYSFEFMPVRVQDVVTAAVAAAGERFRDPGCELQIEVVPDLPDIRADESSLITTLVNLLDNAYKYTPHDKRISLRVFAVNGNVCFEVGDNGVGIASHELKKIFRKFYQADRRLSRTGGGCGLGLSIVHYLVNAHGGSVRVVSEPGKGSTFTVALEAVP